MQDTQGVTQLYGVTQHDLLTQFDTLKKEIWNAVNTISSTPAQKPFLRRAEVAELLGVDLRTVVRWSDKGTLPTYEIEGTVLYRTEDVYACLRKRTAKDSKK